MLLHIPARRAAEARRPHDHTGRPGGRQPAPGADRQNVRRRDPEHEADGRDVRAAHRPAQMMPLQRAHLWPRTGPTATPADTALSRLHDRKDVRALKLKKGKTKLNLTNKKSPSFGCGSHTHTHPNTEQLR